MPAPRFDVADAEKEIGQVYFLRKESDVDEKLWEKKEAVIVHWVKIAVFCLVPLLAGICVIVYLLHLLLPSDWRWLCDEDLAALRSASISILAGVMSSVAVGYFFPKKH